MKHKIRLLERSVFYKLFFVALITGLCPAQMYSQMDPDEAVPKYEIPELKYPAADAFVITYNVMDYGADNTGEKDNSGLFTTLLKKLEGSTEQQGGVGNGGVLFLPEGKYRVDNSLVIPKGVTIRGEWKKPEKGQPIVGTIILTDLGRGSETESNSLIRLEPSSAVKDLAFWYPEQDPNNIIPYPPTILWGRGDYFGNEYCVAQNVTFINSYSGLIFSRKNGGGAPNGFGIYGTPLSRGIEVDNIAEVGRVEGVDFSPAYWEGSGLPGSPENNASFRHWVKNNGTAIVMRRNDWSYTSNIKAEGYFIGFHAVTSIPNPGSKPNGQNYNMTFTNCKTAIYAQDPQDVGIMFHNVNAIDCEYGVFIPEYAGGVVQLSNCSLQATEYAIGVDSNSSTRLLLNQSKITSGKVEVLGGALIVTDSDINNGSPHIVIGVESRAIITGNRFDGEPVIENNSMYECQIDHEAMTNLKKVPEFPYRDPQAIKQKPENVILVVATEEPFNAKNDGETNNTTAIQQALDNVKSKGGGIVYLPPGKYKVAGSLTIPSGVELKGSSDVGSVPTGPGSVLEVYNGKNDETAEPFIKMEEASGIRGIVFNYPEQMFDELLGTTNGQPVVNPHVYPYAIQVTGKDAYIVNVGFRATYRAIDLFTHKADNVYIEYPAGHVFKNGIHVGGGTENALIRNAQFNTIGYACGEESKFGRWKNSPRNGVSNKPCYNQNYRDLEFFILGECKNLLLYNNFYFGCNKGTIFANEGAGPSGIAMGHGIDAAVKALYFEKIGEGGFDLIGSQIVSTQHEVAEGGKNASRYLETASDFDGEVTLFGGDFWGSPYYGVQIGGGVLSLQQTHFNISGSERLAQIEKDGGNLRIYGSSVKNKGSRPVNAGVESQFAAESSIIDAENMNTEQCEKYIFNLTNSPVMIIDNTVDRTGWIATASKNNGNAKNAIDDNVSTRWDTSSSMQNGDWFSVDMREEQVFNKLILDQGGSSDDYPRGYEVYVSNDGKNWGEALVTGIGTSDVTVITLPEPQKAQYVKIIQTGKEELYWSIHEFYIALMDSENIEYPTLIDGPEAVDVKIYYAGEQLFITGLPDSARVNIYNTSGQVVKSMVNSVGNGISVQLPTGIYITIVENAGKVYRQKIIIR